jgi:hypothetical protein
MSEQSAGNDGSAPGPVCPGCRQLLRGMLRQEQIIPRALTEPGPHLPMAVTYCGNCGLTLNLAPAGLAAVTGPIPVEEVVAAADDQTPDGQFQLRCRELVAEIRSLGFNPHVWVALINQLGATGAARKLLADHHRLVATPWLVRRGRPELTMEHEIGRPRWIEVFTDDERAEAARRLAHAEQGPEYP